MTDDRGQQSKKMDAFPSRGGRHVLDGTIRIFLSEAIILPTGLLIAAFLTRRLGPEGYGIFSLSAAIVSWMAWSVSMMFSRASIKLVSESLDWRPIGIVVIRANLYAGGAAMVVLWLLAFPLAGLLEEPSLAFYVALLAVDIPFFSLMHAYQSIVVGQGGFRERAVISAGYWTIRLFVVVVLVELGLSVTGALLGCICASVAGLVICRHYVSCSPFGPSSFPIRRLLGYAAPLFLFAICMRFYDKLDLVMLKALGGSIQQAGFYGAAQNLCLIPGIVGLSFSPLLLSTISRALKEGEEGEAKRLSREALRGVVLLLPFAGMTAGASREIVVLIFGPLFSAAAPLLAWLIFGSLAILMISVATAILTAAGKAGWTIFLAGPMVPLAFIGHMAVIPRWGAPGASFVTTFFAVLGAIASVLCVLRLWRVLPGALTWVRSILICLFVYVCSSLFPASGLLTVLKLTTITLSVPVAFLLMGEFSTREIAFFHSLIQGRVEADRPLDDSVSLPLSPKFEEETRGLMDSKK